MAAIRYDANATVGEIVTISNSVVDSTQTHFVKRIPTSTLNASFLSALRGDYQDIRVYLADGTELDREVQGTSQIWVRVPSLSSLANTPLHFNGGSGVSKGNDATCWTTAGYVLVAHLDDASGVFSDSAGNNDGTNSGCLYSQAAKIGNGTKADNNSDYIDFNDVTALNSVSQFSLEYWMKIPAITNNMLFFIKFNNTSNRIQLQDASGTSIYFRVENGINNGYMVWNGYNTQINTGAFEHYCWTYDGTAGAGEKEKLYLNSSNKVLSAGPNEPSATTPNLATKNLEAMGTSLASISLTNSLMDEFRISNVARDADWISGQYRTQNDPTTYLTASDFTEFGGGRITPMLNPAYLGNSLFAGALA